MISIEQLKALPEDTLRQPCSVQLNIGQALSAARALDCADAAAQGLGLTMPSGARAEFDALKAKFEAAAILALVALQPDPPPT